MADRYKDEYFDASFKTELEEQKAKAELKGKLQIISDVVGLPAFIKSFKEIPSSK